MRSLHLLLVLGLVGLLGACAAPVDDVPHEASLELGTGSWRFESLADGQEVELVRGAQGGWHVWVSLRVRGVDAQNPRVTLVMQPADESRPPSEVELVANLDPADDEGYRDFIGFPRVLDDPSCLVGEMVRIEARIDMGAEGVMASDRYVVPTGGTYPPPACE